MDFPTKKQKFKGSNNLSNTTTSFFAGSTFNHSPEACELPPPNFKHRDIQLNQKRQNSSLVLQNKENTDNINNYHSHLNKDESHTEETQDLIFDFTNL